MRVVQEYLLKRQADLASHPFLVEVIRPDDIQSLMAFAPQLTFWVMSFQDVLRLNEELVRDPEMKRIVRHHKAEDMGHDRWFLQDLSRLGHQVPDASALFDQKHVAVRDATYALMNEVFHARDDRMRVLLLLALEHTGHLFFEVISSALSKHELVKSLKYFSDHHLKVERAHEMFEHRMNEGFFALQLSPEERQGALALVDRVFAAFDRMFHGLRASLPGGRDAATTPPLVPLVAAARAV